MSEFEKPFRVTMEHYDTKVSVEIDHSDISYEQLYDALKSLCDAGGWGSFWEECVEGREE